MNVGGNLTFAADGFPDSDLVLRSKDNVDFHVHRLVLAFASEILRDAFTLPLPPPANRVPPEFDDQGRPVVALQASSKVLRIILRICYLDKTEMMSEDAVEALGIAEMLVMPHVQQYLELWLQNKILADPLYMWAWACHRRRQHQHIAEQAAETWKEKTACLSRERLPVVEAWIDNRGHPVPDFFADPAPDPEIPKIESTKPFFPDKDSGFDWDTTIIAAQGVVFYTASQAFRVPPALVADWNGHKQLMELDSQATWLLLAMCHPIWYSIVEFPLNDEIVGKRVKKTPAVSVYRMLQMARKFEMDDIVERCSSPYKKYKPLCLYLFASQTNRGRLAREAAFAWVKKLPRGAEPEELDVPCGDIGEIALKEMSAMHLRMLCKFRDAYVCERPRDNAAIHNQA